MNAITMLVRKASPPHWRESIFLAVVAGFATSVVGASFQAAARSETSLTRFTQQSRIYDLVTGLPAPEWIPRASRASADLIGTMRELGELLHASRLIWTT